MQLYDYQQTAVSAALRALSATAMALVNLATGLGKTIVMREISKPFKERILFLCHDTDILEQNMERFAELYSKVGEVGLYHGDDKSGFNARFVFATFQTMLTDKGLFGSGAFCLVMVDECHHAPAPTYREVIDYFDCPKLGASATIERLDGLRVENIFGEPVISIDLPEAIAKGYLTPFEYRIMSDGLNQDVLQKLLGEAVESRKLTVDDVNKKLFIQKRDEEIVRTVRREAGNKKTLVFCRNINHANRISRLLNRGAVTTHSGLKRDTNKQRLQAFRHGRVQYLVVVNKANEGVDIPDAEVVVFLRATESKTIFLQQLGRTLRRAEGKVQSLVLDFAGSLQRLSLVQDLAWSIRDEYENGTGGGDSHDAMTVSGAGFDFVFDTEVVQSLELFERLRGTEFYSYAEAQAKVQEMNITDQLGYGKRYGEDSRLPSSPRLTYKDDWQGFPAFLGRDSFRVESANMYRYEDARGTVRAMGIKSVKEYSRRYREDSRLPSNPDRRYVEQWISWSDFLGLKDRRKAYETLDQAKEAARRLGTISRSQYLQRRSVDPKLPAQPDRKYKNDWKGWPNFLGVLSPQERVAQRYTFEEARTRVKEMGVMSQKDYFRRYKEDSRLPSNPNLTYKDSWKGYKHFLGKE